MRANRPAVQVYQIIFLMLFLALTVLFIPVQRSVTGKIAELKSGILSMVESRTGRRISIRSISPSIFRYVEIRDLTIFGLEHEREVLLEIRKVKVYYNIFKLLFDNPISSLNEISFENSFFNFDLEKDQDLVEFFRGFTGEDSPPGESPSMKGILLSGKNLSFNITMPEGTLALSDVFFRIRPRNGLFSTQLSCVVSAELTTDSLPFSKARSVLGLTGDIGRDLSSADLMVKISSFSTDVFSLLPQTFQVGFRDSQVELRKIQDRAPVDISILFDTRSGNTVLAFNGESFRFSSLAELRGDLETYNGWLETRITGRGRVEYLPSRKEVLYAGSLTTVFQEKSLPWLSAASGTFSGTVNEVHIDALTLTTPYGKLDFIGKVPFADLIPEGIVRVRSAGFERDRSLDMEILLKRKAGQSLHAVTNRLVYGELESRSFEAVLRRTDETVSFSASLSLAGTSVENKVSAEGSLRLGRERFLELFLTLGNIPVETCLAVTAVFPGVALSTSIPSDLNHLLIDSTLSVFTDFKSFSVTIPRMKIANPRDVEDVLWLSASGTNSRLEFRNLTGMWAGRSLSGSLSVGIPNLRSIDFGADFSIEDVPYRLQGIYTADRGLSLTGSHEFALELVVMEETGIAFTVRASDLPVPFQGKSILLGVSAEGTYRDPSTWELSADSLRISGLSDLPFGEDIVLSGMLRPEMGTISSISITDRFSTVSGSGEIRMDFPGLKWAEGNMTLAGKAGSERYAVNFRYADEGLRGRVEFSKAPVERLLVSDLSGKATGTVEFQGSLPVPDFTLDLTLDDMLYDKVPVTGKVLLESTEVKTVIRSLDIEYDRNSLRATDAEYNADSGIFRGLFQFRRKNPQNPLGATILLRGAVINPERGKKQLFELPQKEIDALIEVTDITIGMDTVDPWNVTVQKLEKKITFTGGPENAIQGVFELPGTFMVTVGSPLPVRFVASGRFDGTDIESEVRQFSLDPDVLNNIIRRPEIHFTEGRVSGELKVTGPVNDPDIFGTIRVDRGYATSNLSPDRIGPFSSTLLVAEKTISISRFKTPVGSASLNVEGTFELDHWGLRYMNLDLITDSDRGMHVVYNFHNVKVNGYGRGMMNIAGDTTGLRLSGNFLVSNCVIALVAIETDLMQKNTDFSIKVDLNFRTGRQVEFIWPERFPVLRAVSATDEDLRIEYDSDSREYRVGGMFEIKGGEIFYLDRRFYLREGRLTLQENQDGFDPRLTARAETREVIDNKSVRIYLVADENRLSRFSPRFESDTTGITNAKIMDALGQRIVTPMTSGVSDALLFTSDIVGHFSFMRTLERNIQKGLNLDLFSIRTQMVQNIIRDTILPSGTPLDNSAPLVKYLDNTTLLFGKYLGNDLFLESMVQLSASEGPAAQDLGDLIGWELSLEWKTPFFLLDWSFMPKKENRENLYLKDNTFSFSWKYSY